MRKTFSAFVLVLALACAAYAGDMPNGTPVPPPQTASQVPTTTDGDMPNGQPQTITEIVLSVLTSALPLV